MRKLSNLSNWKHAIGEVCLIVVGVTLALAANSWYEEIQERAEEVRALRQLRSALEADVADFAAFYSSLKLTERELGTLLDALDARQLSPDMSSALGHVSYWHAIEIRTGPYEEIKNRGFALISDAALRSSLIDLYERAFPALRGTIEADIAFSSNQVSEYFYRNFARDVGGPWVPIGGYDALHEDGYFRNLVVAKMNRLQAFFLPSSERFTSASRSVLEKLDSEIARLSNQ